MRLIMSQERNNKEYSVLREASPLTAEMVAAVRVRTEDTPEAKALVTFTGHVIANIFYALAPKKVINISPVRELTTNYLVDKYLPDDGQKRIFVDLACGYSSRGAVLARQRPDVTVYEIDLPAVITQKKLRYARRKINLPDNLKMVSADMKISSLSDLLDGQKADVVMSRGLFIYFDKDTITLAARNIFDGLKSNGHFITDLVFGTEQSLGTFSAIINFIRKQTNSDASRGRVATLEEGEQLFHDAGYATVKAYHFSDFEDKVDLPQAYLDMMLVVDAQPMAEDIINEERVATIPTALKPNSEASQADNKSKDMAQDESTKTSAEASETDPE
jgi:O-methyltransferase involved in polyketide biosynthesis